MDINWDGRYVLLPVKEPDEEFHWIYFHSDKYSSITDSINSIDWAPMKLSRKVFKATPIKPPEPWLVRFDGTLARVLMGVFQLNRVS